MKKIHRFALNDMAFEREHGRGVVLRLCRKTTPLPTFK
jgi:hypothetical protein